MCGLFGYATASPVKRLEQAALQLALYNEERGKQSWGATDGKRIYKDIGPIGRNLYKIPFSNNGILLAHTRAATVGDISKTNAHPFSFKMKNKEAYVVGAHNGCVSNHTELNTKYNRNLAVDSMHIFKHIADNEPLNEIEGYGAIVFIKDDVLCFAKFNSGQLSIAHLKKGGLVWSSEEFALVKALEGANIDFTLYNVKEDHLFLYSDNILKDSGDKVKIGSRQAKFTRLTPNRYYNDNFNSNRVINPNDDKRIIRIRIIKDTSGVQPLTPEQTTIEEIEKNIFNDDKITKTVMELEPCAICSIKTIRRLLDGRVVCLPCTAKMIHNGAPLAPMAN